jgi:hypothetical protein
MSFTSLPCNSDAACISGDCDGGYGSYVLETGNKYSGYWTNGRPNGLGKYIFRNGQNYTGDFVKGKFSGFGSYVWPSGETYIGRFANGRPKGLGIRYFGNGTARCGVWDGKRLVKPMTRVNYIKAGGIVTPPIVEAQPAVQVNHNELILAERQRLAAERQRIEKDTASLNHQKVDLERKGKTIADANEALAAIERERQQLIVDRQRLDEDRLASVVPVQSFTSVHAPRIALIIGNGAYTPSGALKNPPNDAVTISKALKKVGFEVETLTNVDRRRMITALQGFSRRAHGTIALFFYSGHGVQVKGENYLIPINAKINSEADVEHEALPVQRIFDELQNAKSRLNIVFFDACRNNPFGRSYRSQTAGLASMSAPQGSIIGFSTAPGKVASDGAGGNSPYVNGFIKNIGRNVSVEAFLKDVARTVISESRDEQRPWYSSNFVEEFSFVARQ